MQLKFQLQCLVNMFDEYVVKLLVNVSEIALNVIFFFSGNLQTVESTKLGFSVMRFFQELLLNQ